MLKKIEWFLQFLYYFILKFHLALQKLPITWLAFLLKFSVVEGFFKLLGAVNPKERLQEQTSVLLDPEESMASGQADAHIWGIVFLVYMFITFTPTMKYKFSSEIYLCFIAVDALAAFATVYFFVFRNNKYRQYVKKFNKWQQSEKYLFGMIATIIILLCWSLFFMTWIVAFRM